MVCESFFKRPFVDSDPCRSIKCVGSRQPLSQDKENRDAQPLVKTTSLKATGGATGGATGEAAESNRNENGVLQVDKLREELTCVVRFFSLTDRGHNALGTRFYGS